MSSEKINQPLEKVNTSNNNNLEEKNEIKESISQNNGDQTYSQRIHSDNIFQEENDQNSEKEDKLKLYTPFKINAFYQILINKIMPPGYKLETEYKVYSKKDIVTKVETKTTITSKKEKILKKFEKELNEQYETNNNNYGGYEYKANLKDNSLTANVSIDYTKYDMKKFASDNVAIKEYLNKDKQFTLEGAKKYYNTIGATCK